eukprot:10466563-Prorocentrum_lima.AAC.1
MAETPPRSCPLTLPFRPLPTVGISGPTCYLPTFMKYVKAPHGADQSVGIIVLQLRDSISYRMS